MIVNFNLSCATTPAPPSPPSVQANAQQHEFMLASERQQLAEAMQAVTDKEQALRVEQDALGARAMELKGEVGKHLSAREEVLRKWEQKLERRQRGLDARSDEHDKWCAARSVVV